MSEAKKPVVVAVSGGFDPLHVGHIRYFKAAKALGDKLIVIINNDNWLRLKKGYVFMDENQRKEIIESVKWVDEVVISEHQPGTQDISITHMLLKIKPNIFAKGGDRNPEEVPIPGSEPEACAQIGCKIIYNVGDGGKIESSSGLVRRAMTDLGKRTTPAPNAQNSGG